MLKSTFEKYFKTIIMLREMCTYMDKNNIHPSKIVPNFRHTITDINFTRNGYLRYNNMEYNTTFRSFLIHLLEEYDSDVSKISEFLGQPIYLTDEHYKRAGLNINWNKGTKFSLNTFLDSKTFTKRLLLSKGYVLRSDKDSQVDGVGYLYFDTLRTIKIFDIRKEFFESIVYDSEVFLEFYKQRIFDVYIKTAWTALAVRNNDLEIVKLYFIRNRMLIKYYKYLKMCLYDDSWRKYICKLDYYVDFLETSVLWRLDETVSS